MTPERIEELRKFAAMRDQSDALDRWCVLDAEDLLALLDEVIRLRAELAGEREAKGCPWSADLEKTICPEHGGPIGACPIHPGFTAGS